MKEGRASSTARLVATGERLFRLRDLPSADDLRRRYLAGVEDSVDLAEGQRICVAERL